MLPSYWNQKMTFSIGFIHGLCQQGVNISVLVSPSKEGDLGEAVLKQVGIGVLLRGSVHRTSALALRDVYLNKMLCRCSSRWPFGSRLVRLKWGNHFGAPIIPIVNACSRKIYLNG